MLDSGQHDLRHVERNKKINIKTEIEIEINFRFGSKREIEMGIENKTICKMELKLKRKLNEKSKWIQPYSRPPARLFV